ncbi:TadA family conjugal transfer-associated ATPase [Brevibacterium sp. Marseille-P9724]|uniref:TadA family conjugal transfer-associated ATPase n=1 Tax=Brevibacterium sp. Marseille-P9724 TaxID=2614125 RepID=UPI00125FAD86|nr:TadA family conjugal transfer-associated ATPase [Brevibacterium sp. Marseille-P9724]
MTLETQWLDAELIRDVRTHLLENPGPVTAGSVAAALARSGRVVGSAELLELVSRISAQLGGAGPLQSLLDEPDVTDVFVNSPQDVWIDRGSGLTPVPLSLGTEDDVRALAVRLAALGGRRLDDSQPLVDVRLPDGVRLNALIPPLAGENTVMSFRVPRSKGFRLSELIDRDFVPADIAEVLLGLLEVRANILISGGTGSGKTVLLGALLAELPADQRIVIVEDSRELNVRHDHVVQLAARQANVEGMGEVSMADLVRNALRMRPDRLIIGECRGAEVRDMLTALNTGHEGGCATIHANTASAVPARLEALGALAGMTSEAVRSQSVTAIDVILHITRGRDGHRRLSEIAARTSSGRPAPSLPRTQGAGTVEAGDTSAELATVWSAERGPNAGWKGFLDWLRRKQGARS